MQYHSYDPITGEYLATGDARENPKVDGEYLLPRHATFTAPCDVGDGCVAVFDVGVGSWGQQEDYRGECGYVNGTRCTIDSLGPLPDGWCGEAPPCPLHVWSDGWVRGVAATISAISLTKAAKIAEGYTHTDGNTYQIREFDIANMDRMMAAFARGETNPHDGKWATIDNRFEVMSNSEASDLFIAAAQYRDGVIRACSEHKYAVSAMTDVQAASYDFSVNWP